MPTPESFTLILMWFNSGKYFIFSFMNPLEVNLSALENRFKIIWESLPSSIWTTGGTFLSISSNRSIFLKEHWMLKRSLISVMWSRRLNSTILFENFWFLIWNRSSKSLTKLRRSLAEHRVIFYSFVPFSDVTCLAKLSVEAMIELRGVFISWDTVAVKTS